MNREKFGLYHVNFNDPQRKRTPKISAHVFAHICKTHTIDWNYRPTLDNEQISAESRLSDLEHNSGINSYANHFITLTSLLITIILAKFLI